MCRFYIYILLFLTIFGYQYSQDTSYVSFYNLCRTNGYVVKFNLNIGYADVSKDSNSLKVFLTMPYIVSSGRYIILGRIQV